MSKLTAVAGAILICGAAQAADLSKDTSPWWGHIKVLASNELEGRLTGSPGYVKAAQYVAAHFERAGMKPAGTDGYFQSVGFEVQALKTELTRVQLTRANGAPAVDVKDDLVLSPGTLQRRDSRAPLVFAGYGIHLPEAGYDDFAGLDIRGAVVVLLVGGPSQLSGTQRAYALAEALPHYLEAQGAVGLLSITSPKNREVPWARQRAAGTQPGMLLAEQALRRYQGAMLAGAFDETKADVLFENSGHRFAQLVALADAHQPLPRFRLARGIEAHVESTLSEVSSDNVVAELPGSDPAQAAEAVVLSAHLDHLGTGVPDHGDGIFHGAMDNAAGVASLLEIAGALHAASAKPHRSILVLVVSGEEKGLLGSRYFAAHPSRHAGHFVADINADMFLPLYPLRHVVGYGADESSIGDDVRAIGTNLGVALVPDPTPDHLAFVRSDQYNFVRKGTPAVMLTLTPAPGTSEETTLTRWYRERYHAQADDLGQPVDLAAADAYTRLVYQLAVRLADAPGTPRWRPDSFFARFATQPLP